MCMQLMDNPPEATANGVFIQKATMAPPAYVGFFGGYTYDECADQAQHLELALLRDGLHGKFSKAPYLLMAYDSLVGVPWGRHNEVLFFSTEW